MNATTRIVLVNMGGPNRLEDVESYLFNIFMDADLIRAPFGPFRPLIARYIAKKRSSKTRQIYQALGGKSPLLPISQAQVDLLQQELNQQFSAKQLNPVKVHLAMRYWDPLMTDLWTEMAMQGVQKAILLPAYPFYSIPSTGSIINLAKTLSLRAHIQLQVIDSFANDEYAALTAHPIQVELDRAAQNGSSYEAVLLSAHSIPMGTIRKMGDPYAQQIQDCVQIIKERLSSDVPVYLSYQSKVGPVEWLGPSTANTLRQLAQMGVQRLLVSPLGFVTDNSETLYEISMEYKQLAHDLGISVFQVLPCPNQSPQLIQLWTKLIMQKLNSMENSP